MSEWFVRCRSACVLTYHPQVQVPPLRRLASSTTDKPQRHVAPPHPPLCSTPPRGAKITLWNVNRLQNKHTAFCGPSPRFPNWPPKLGQFHFGLQGQVYGTDASWLFGNGTNYCASVSAEDNLDGGNVLCNSLKRNFTISPRVPFSLEQTDGHSHQFIRCVGWL